MIHNSAGNLLMQEQISVNKDDFEAHQLKNTHIHRVQQAKTLAQITPKTEGSVTSGVDSIFTDEDNYEIDKILNDELGKLFMSFLT